MILDSITSRTMNFVEQYTKRSLEIIKSIEKDFHSLQGKLFWNTDNSQLVYEEITDENPLLFESPVNFTIKNTESPHTQSSLSVFLFNSHNQVHFQLNIPAGFNDFINKSYNRQFFFRKKFIDEIFDVINATGIVTKVKGAYAIEDGKNDPISTFLLEHCSGDLSIPFTDDYADFKIQKAEFSQKLSRPFCFDGNTGNLSIQIMSISPLVVFYEFTRDYEDLELTKEDELYIKSIVESINWVRSCTPNYDTNCGLLISNSPDKKIDKMLELYLGRKYPLVSVIRQRKKLGNEKVELIDISVIFIKEKSDSL